MPREITHHESIIEAIRGSGVIAELLETHDNHFKYELDLELIVYGRTYADQRVGPYARLLLYGSGEEVIHQGDWGGNHFYVLIDGKLDVFVADGDGTNKKVDAIQPKASFGEMSVLSGRPRNATVSVPSGWKATVLEIQRPALRLLRKLKSFGSQLESHYRQYGLEHMLRELQDAITSKALWSLFEPRFANKEALATKFDQLAELRNGIRHSRAVSEIVRKEGEAAILWFKQVLTK